MSFEELGLMLRQERERRELSVEEVAGRLKLMPRIVRAIEQGDVEALPQAAYARGFVKAYGNLLELEQDVIYDGMEDAWPGEDHHASADAAEERQSGGKGRFAAFFVLLLILAAAGGFWLARDLDWRLPSGVLPKAEPAISPKSEVPPQAVPAKGDPPVVSPAPVVAAPAVPAQSAVPAAPADGRRTENIPAATPQAAFSPAGASPAQQEGPHNLVIIALAECWAHSNADNSDTRQFSLRKGDTFALTFNKKLVLKLGNAGGVRLRLDGRDLEPPGEVGQVKTLTFPAGP
jgi:cytoskeleton protein RodZ